MRELMCITAAEEKMLVLRQLNGALQDALNQIVESVNSSSAASDGAPSYRARAYEKSLAEIHKVAHAALRLLRNERKK